MKYEQIKSWLLTGLVLLSIVLFWNLVTYQHNYDFVNNQQFTREVNIADKKEIGELIVPNKIIYRTAEDEYYGTENVENMKPIIDMIYEWDILNYQSGINEFKEKFINNPANPALIIQFPDDLPYNLFKTLYSIETESVPSGSFSLMILFPEQMERYEGSVYFTTPDFNSVIRVTFNYSNINTFLSELEEFHQETSPYIAYQKNDGTFLYVLKDEIVLNTHQYFTRYYEINDFKDALFSDPNLVSQNGNRYTDGLSLMDVNLDLGMLSYVNPTVSLETSTVTLNDLLDISIAYINEHSGWSDNYYYSFSNPISHEIMYQLYLRDYPVINVNKLSISEMTLKLGNSGVYSYQRPFFWLEVPYPSVNREYELPSGETIISYLDNLERLSLDAVDDIVIGYHLQKDSENPLIYLQPSWFYRVDSRWERISEEEVRGEIDGLE